MALVQQLYREGKLDRLSRNGELDIADQDLLSVVLASLSCIYLEEKWQKLLVQNHTGTWRLQDVVLYLSWTLRPGSRSDRIRPPTRISKPIWLSDLNYMLDWPDLNRIIPEALSLASESQVWKLEVIADQEHVNNRLAAACDFRFTPGAGTWRLTTFTICTSTGHFTNVPCRKQAHRPA